MLAVHLREKIGGVYVKIEESSVYLVIQYLHKPLILL